MACRVMPSSSYSSNEVDPCGHSSRVMGSWGAAVEGEEEEEGEEEGEEEEEEEGDVDISIREVYSI